MDRKTVLIQALELYNVREILEKRKRSGGKVTYDLLLEALVNNRGTSLSSSLLNIASPSTIANLTKALFPDKPRTSKAVDNFLFSKLGLKECRSCDGILPFSEFRLNKIKSDGLNTYCKSCQSNQTAKTQPARQSRYRAAQLNRTPSWANLENIQAIYDNCPAGYHVDHIIPLQGNLVSGLHVEYNLQYLPAVENMAKSNKYVIE